MCLLPYKELVPQHMHGGIPSMCCGTSGKCIQIDLTLYGTRLGLEIKRHYTLALVKRLAIEVGTQRVCIVGSS